MVLMTCLKGPCLDVSTLFMGKPILTWAMERGITLGGNEDIQNAPLFPVCQTVDELGKVLRWMITELDREEGKHIWLSPENYRRMICPIKRIYAV